MSTKLLTLLGMSLTMIFQLGCQQKEHEIVKRKSDSLDTFKFQVPDNRHLDKKDISKRSASSPDHSNNGEESTSETKTNPPSPTNGSAAK